MSGLDVPEPILNSPFAEPKEHWLIREGEPPERLPGRRAAACFYGSATSGRAAKGAPKDDRRAQAANVGHADINLTHPEWSRVLTRNLAKSAGGLADDAKASFKTTDYPRYRAILKAIEEGKAALLAKPRMDMPGAVPIPQERDFGRTF